MLVSSDRDWPYCPSMLLLAQSTRTPERITIDEPDSRLDWATAVGIVAAALGAFAAVAVALYLSVWRERRTAPDLTLEFSDEGQTAVYSLDDEPGPAVVHALRVSNSPGNRSAQRVEVLLTVGYWLPPHPREIAEEYGIVANERFVEVIGHDPLTFWNGDPPQKPGTSSAVVPSGVTRKVSILYSGTPRTMFESFVDPGMKWDNLPGDQKWWLLRRTLGFFLTVPLGTDHEVDNQLAWQIRLTVAAEDVDAVTYRTQLKWLIQSEGTSEGREMLAVAPVWEPLIRIKEDEWPGPMPKEWWGHTSGSLDQDELWEIADQASKALQLNFDDEAAGGTQGSPSGSETE